jgi:hypothetical protein
LRNRLGPHGTLVLASIPEAAGFYEKVGTPRMADVFLPFYRPSER